MIGIYSCSLLTTAELCAQVHARTYRRCVFEKCFPSLHFTDNVVDLVSSVAIGLTFKDFLTTFRLVCHVLSTNRSWHVSLNRVSHSPSRMQSYIWLDVHYGIFFFALMKVTGNRQSFACFPLPSTKSQRWFGKESHCKGIQLSVLKL